MTVVTTTGPSVSPTAGVSSSRAQAGGAPQSSTVQVTVPPRSGFAFPTSLSSNKRYLLDVLERELRRARRIARPLSVLMFDVDHFKKINDTHGHLAGDEVLSELCCRARGFLQQEEVLARYGGEEFVLLLPETPLAEALQVAERLRTTVAETQFATEQAAINVSISLGVAQFAGNSQTVAELLDRADQQLYAAKRGGRNRVAG